MYFSKIREHTLFCGTHLEALDKLCQNCGEPLGQSSSLSALVPASCLRLLSGLLVASVRYKCGVCVLALVAACHPLRRPQHLTSSFCSVPCAALDESFTVDKINYHECCAKCSTCNVSVVGGHSSLPASFSCRLVSA